MAERFAADWLALREPADHAARPEALLETLNRALAGRERPLQVMDLGSGAGSNMRYLAPRLTGPQHWTLVDHDSALLATVEEPDQSVTLSRQVVDFAAGPPSIQRNTDLLTASALLDLVSAAWIDRLVAMLTEWPVPVLFSLSYDGRVRWSQPHATDERVRQAVNRHQRTDKGFGQALGPGAADYCVRALSTKGLHVVTERSDWKLYERQAALAAALIEGWAGAASEMDPDGRDVFQDWARSRQRDIAAGRVRLGVGHCDMLVLP